jgi:hypothetical protein
VEEIRDVGLEEEKIACQPLMRQEYRDENFLYGSSIA